MAVSNTDYAAAYELLRTFLKRARDAKGLSQAEVAAKLDVPQSYVSKYETGERRLDLVETLDVLDALGEDAAAFIRKFRRAAAGERMSGRER